MDIGLTLSGGGFRATLFHLGVIQYLRKANLLHAVRHITAVSGGSIIAAHVAMNWDRYSGSDEQFKTVSQELIDFTQLGVREHIITWLPAIWVVRFLRKITFRKSTYNQSSLLSKMYAEYLFKKATNGTLKIHQTMPDVALASTNLSRPENLVTFSATGVTLHGPEGCEIKTQAISLAHAVTASSAFPLLFPAISIDNSMLGQSSGKLTPSPQYLSDGGIFDNYGIRALYEIRRGKPAFDLLIVSDAGARAEWEPNVSFGSISLLNRAAAITGQRVSDLERETASMPELTKKTAVISIHETEDPAPSTQNLAPDLQRQLGKVRTDLDSFSNLLVHCLGSHGYSMARKAITATGIPVQAAVPHWNPLEPNNPVSPNLQSDMQALQQEAFTRWRLLSFKEWKPLGMYLAFLIALLIYVPPVLVTTLDKINITLREYQRTEWRAAAIELESNKFGDQALLTTMQNSMSEAEKDRLRMDRWLGWINDGIRPKTQREKVLLIESVPFDNYYRKFVVSIACDSHIKLAEGIAFLVSSEGPTYQPVYRQMKMSFDQSGNNPPTITLASPQRGEKLLLILRAETRDSDPAARLPSTTPAFHINLETK